MESNVFNELNKVNVNEHVEKKTTGSKALSYLSWSWAWAEVKKRYPDASYEIVKFENGLPYTFDPNTGYMVYTKVTIKDITHEMWLPVMDSHNAAMLAESYTVKTKYSSYTVDKCTMFDVNKTIMRCLVKNLAMFGLGLYIYAGEDLPEDDERVSSKKSQTTSKPAEPPSEDVKKHCEELKAKLMDFEDTIPKESWKDIDAAVNAGSVPFLEKMLAWAGEESKKAS
jgi:hypothetical protein